MPVSRATRAQLARDAARIRAGQQRRGAPVPAIVAQITRALPVTPLEAWRLAYGWSRPHVVDAVGEVFRSDGLAPPGLTTAMLCRWEHGQTRPGVDYVQALARVYGADPTRLGVPLPTRGLGWYRHRIPHPRQEHRMSSEHPDLTAVADSIVLNGPGTGVLDLAQRAVEFYSTRYSDYPPPVLAAEVARCRSALLDGSATSTEIRRVVGWLSALLGNLAHHTGDGAGAHIHLGTASRVGVDVGEPRLAGWALGALSMVVMSQDRPAEALDLADQAEEYANDPLRRAQITAWCRLRPLAALGDSDGLDQSITAARRYMDTADREESDRFGFDRAEFHLHMAEACLGRDAGEAARHAETSAGLKRVGSPGWAAATTAHARAYAAFRDGESAAALGMSVLEAVPAGSMRANNLTRLRRLVVDVGGRGELADAVRARLS